MMNKKGSHSAWSIFCFLLGASIILVDKFVIEVSVRVRSIGIGFAIAAIIIFILREITDHVEGNKGYN